MSHAAGADRAESEEPAPPSTEAEAAPDEPHEPAHADVGPSEPDQPARVDAASTPAPALAVEGLGLRGSHGWSYRDVSFTVLPGQVAALVGPAGCGKSTLLLALAGRMRPTTGTVRVGDVTLPGTRRDAAAARRAVAVARIADLVGLDPELSVARNASDAADWAGVRRPDAEDSLDRWRHTLELDLTPSARLAELPALEATTLHLVLATLARPAVVVLDDLGHDLTWSERERMWGIAAAVAADGPAVVAATLDTMTVTADVVVALGGGIPEEDIA